MNTAINKSELSVILGISETALRCLIEKSANFPSRINTGKKRTIDLFDRNEVMAWAVHHQKGFCTVMAQQAIRGKLWIINKQAGHG